MRNTIATILAGGQGERLSVLSSKRAKPAVPFAGKYRIIDFTLSNCVNSGLYNVAVLTQYRPHSLNDHIRTGRPWDLDRNRGGVRLLQPYLGRRESDWYRGTADAVYQNLTFLFEDYNADLMLVLSGDHVYRMDYRKLLAFHEAKQADCTVAVFEVPLREAHRFGTLIVDDDQRVVEFEEKPARPRSTLISMGIYVFERPILEQRLEEDARSRSRHDFGGDILPRMVELDRVYAYRFRGYWRDVGTIQSYWEANMGLLAEPPEFELYDPTWVIHTRSEERPPAKISSTGAVSRSLISHGCTIHGTVEHSVLSPGVFVAEGAYVRDSIVMTDCIIGPNSVLDRVILDKEVVVGTSCQLGVGEANTPNRLEPRRLNTGISLVGKRARIPSGLRMGRNCRIDPDVTERDFGGRSELPSGESIVRVDEPRPIASIASAE
ncbi:MAG: glucose-1-phosphate adenylyltransferase [Chloroflexi bacterium]|nr:glucose-1-phosphate adenylyltransferase [Chloroflexota bacterium]